MRYKITAFQVCLLGWIARKIVVQSHMHKSNIIKYYEIINDAAHNEFTEDNEPTLNGFLTECHAESLRI